MKPFDYGKEERQPEVIVLDIGVGEVQEASIINEAEVQGIINESEVFFANQITDFIDGRSDNLTYNGCINGLNSFYDRGFISEENYNCLKVIINKVSLDYDMYFNIFDLRDQAREAYAEVERNIAERAAERAIVESYVNEEFLSGKLGWEFDNIDSRLGVNYIEDMRALMLEYGLTDEKSILLFLMTITCECQYGSKVTESYTDGWFDDKSYTINTRGAGLIQLTGPDQREFLIYLRNHTENQEEKEILDNYINNFENYEEPDAKNPCDCTVVKPNTVADYIAENYPIEAALWYWCVYEKAEIDGEPLSLNECIETYGDSADPFMMYIGVQCAVNGSEFKPRGIGRFFRYWNSIEISDDTYWQKITTENGKVIYKKHEDGSIILYYSDTENGDKEPPVYSYKPNKLDDRIAIYESVMGPVNETQP